MSRRTAALAVVLTLAACAAGCGDTAPTPGDIAESYLSALASGDYTNACGQLNAQARAALVKAYGAAVPCREVFAHCLPNQANNLNKDQSQLLFANEDITTRGHHASVSVNGTAVARRVKRVSLVEKQGNWHLVSYGSGLTHCRAGHTKKPKKK